MTSADTSFAETIGSILPKATHYQSQELLSTKNDVIQEYPTPDNDEIVELAPPDTKYAWLIVAAVFCNYAITMGTVNSFGVYQEFYLNNMYKDDSAAAIAWISTLQTFCMFFGSVLTGKLTDMYGFRVTCLTGAVICGVALILASFTHTIWQLMLTQGIMLGLGASLIFSPSMSIVAQWHVKHRVLATGIAVSGGGVGGIIFAKAIRKMMDSIGYRWSLRVLGFLIAAVGGSVSMLYKHRICAPKTSNTKLLYKLCMDPRFLFINLALVFLDFGFYEPVFYMPTAAVMETGFSSTAANIVLVFNAGATVGRLLSGAVSAALGPINANILSNLLICILIFVLLQGVKTIAGYYVFNAIYGALSTLYLALNAHILANEFGTQSIATAIGLNTAASGVGALIGNPVQGALYENYDRPHGRFTAVTVWAGTSFALVTVCYVALRIFVVRKHNFGHFAKV